MTTPKPQDFDLWQGEDKEIQAFIVDLAGLPVDLTGFSARWIISRTVNQTVLIDKSAGSGLTIVDGDATNDTIVMLLDKVDTDSLAAGHYYHELRITTTTSFEDVALIGEITLHPSLTL